MRRLVGELWVTSGPELTYVHDASAYLLKGDEPTLIDCGSSDGYAALRSSLRGFGYGPRDIVRVLATHGHWDHVAGMALLRQESDAEFWVHQGDRQAVETGDWNATAAFLYNRPFPAALVDRPLVDGEIITINGVAVHVIHTPGHTPGSVCFWMEIEGTKLLIGGDTLWGGYSRRFGSNMTAWRKSLDRLLQLDFEVASIGHLPPILMTDAKTKVARSRATMGALFNPWFSWDYPF